MIFLEKWFSNFIIAYIIYQLVGDVYENRSSGDFVSKCSRTVSEYIMLQLAENIYISLFSPIEPRVDLDFISGE